MKVTIRITTLVGWLVFFVVLANDCFFYYAQSTVYMSETNKMLITCVAILLYVLCGTNGYCKSIVFSNNGFLNSYIYLYIAIICLETVYSMIRYSSEDIPAMMNNVIPYFFVLFYAPVMIIEHKHNGIIWKMLNFAFIVWTMLSLAQIYLYNSSGVVFMSGFTNRWGNIEYRNGGMRLLHGLCFYNIMVLFNFFKALDVSIESRKRLFHTICFLVGFYIVFFVEQSRSMSVVVLICIVFMLLYRRLSAAGLITNLVLFGAMAIGLIATNFFSYILMSVTGDSTSNTMRGYALVHFLEAFLSNPIMGMGFTNDKAIVHGELGMAFVDDVGIFGQMARMGICFFILYIPVLVRMYHVQKQLRAHNSSKADFVFMLFMYTLLSSGSLIIFDPQRIALLPIILATVECEYSVLKNDNYSQIGTVYEK